MSGIGAWIVKSGRRIWSEEIFRIHGVPVKRCHRHKTQAIALYHPDDRDLIRHNLSDAVTRRENFEGHYRIVRAGGELRHVLTRGRCEIDPDTGEVGGLFGVIMDITELTRTQRELGEATAHLRATLDNMDQGLIKVAPDGTIELSNRRFAELLDLPATLLDGPAPKFENVVALTSRRRATTYRRAIMRAAERIAGPRAPPSENVRTVRSWRSEPCRSPEAAWSGPMPTSRRGAGRKTPSGTAKRSTGCWPTRRATS